MRKRLYIALVAAVLAMAGFLVAVRHRSKVAQEQRESEYQAAMIPYQRDLSIGMTRAQVANYLESRHIVYTWAYYGGDAASYLVPTGREEEHLRFFCGPWSVYIALEFSASSKSSGMDPQPSDTLKRIRIRKEAVCA